MAKTKHTAGPFQIGDKVNAINCREAGEASVVGMEIVSEPWMLGHGEEVVRVKRGDGKYDTRATRQLALARAGARP